jgi:hypothetical protein
MKNILLISFSLVTLTSFAGDGKTSGTLVSPTVELVENGNKLLAKGEFNCVAGSAETRCKQCQCKFQNGIVLL